MTPLNPHDVLAIKISTSAILGDQVDYHRPLILCRGGLEIETFDMSLADDGSVTFYIGHHERACDRDYAVTTDILDHANQQNVCVQAKSSSQLELTKTLV